MMKQYRGNLSIALIPSLILAAIAAVGWYYYYTELDSNKNFSELSLSQQRETNRELQSQQATIAKLQDDQIRRQETIDKLKDDQIRQKETIDKLQNDQIRQQDSIEEQQGSIEALKQSEKNLQTNLASAEALRQDLIASLETTRDEKLMVETSLQQQVKRVELTTAELEAELEKRRAAQQSLNEEISTVSGEKTALLIQLEEEQTRKKEIANLKNRLEQELDESRVEITQLKNQMTVIKLTSEVLFSSGSATIKPAGKRVLALIAESLNTYPDRAISVEGHTDNVVVRNNARYQSNWELSAARSMAAVDFFQQSSEVDPKRLRIVGYGQYHPTSSNETAEGRQLNRRIEIRMLPPETLEVRQN